MSQLPGVFLCKLLYPRSRQRGSLPVLCPHTLVNQLKTARVEVSQSFGLPFTALSLAVGATVMLEHSTGWRHTLVGR